MARKSRPAAPPDGIAAEHIDRRGGMHHHASVLSLLVLGAIVAWGASGYAGSRVERRSVAADALALVVSSPSLIRNGEVYETTFEVTARRRIGKLVFAVSPGLWRETAMNSMLPQPGEQTFEDGMFRFAFEPLEAGVTFIVKADLQINPSLFGDNAGEVVVLDGRERLASLPLRIRVLP